MENISFIIFQRLVFEEIDHGNSNQPDVVRLVDCNTRNRNATPVQDYSYVAQSGKSFFIYPTCVIID